MLINDDIRRIIRLLENAYVAVGTGTCKECGNKWGATHSLDCEIGRVINLLNRQKI